MEIFYNGSEGFLGILYGKWKFLYWKRGFVGDWKGGLCVWFRQLDKVIGKVEEGNVPSTKEILEDMYKALLGRFMDF